MSEYEDVWDDHPAFRDHQIQWRTQSIARWSRHIRWGFVWLVVDVGFLAFDYWLWLWPFALLMTATTWFQFRNLRRAFTYRGALQFDIHLIEQGL